MFLVPFWALKKGVLLLAMQALLSHRILSKNILICVPKMNEGFTDVERHEGELLMTEFSFLGELTLSLTPGSL